ncbi:MAG TPA: hypothetical protein VEI02_08390, partial [Planctomycetota bacterium]|nr:hypothetical protein [Planctomycetota bacterium]
VPEAAAEELRIYDAYAVGVKVFDEARKERTAELWTKAIKEFEKIDESAGKINDVAWLFYAAWFLAECHRGQLEHFETAYFLKRAIDCAREVKLTYVSDRENFPGTLKKMAELGGLRDDKIDPRVSLAEAKEKYKAELERMNAPPDEKPADGGKPADPKSAGKTEAPKGAGFPPPPNRHGETRVEWTDLEKTKVKEVGDRPYLTTNIRSNAAPLRWMQRRIPPDDAQPFDAIPGPNKIKNDGGKLLFDPDGDGKAEAEKLKLGIKPELMKFPKRDFGGGVTADVWFRMALLPGTYKLMGFDAKEDPKSGQTFLYSCGMASTAKFDGFDVTVYDDNADGRFNSWAEDCVVVSKGKDRRVQPLSKVIYVGDKLYEIDVDAAGQHLKLKPYDGNVALVKVEMGAGPAPVAMIARGTGDRTDLAFNMVDAKDKWLWVVPGDYKIEYGYFAFGEAEKRETIEIDGATAKPFTVKLGEQNVLQAAGGGKGYVFRWRAEKSGDVVTLKGADIKVLGAMGESYMNFMPGVLRPTVRMRVGASGTPFYEKQMARPDEGSINQDGALRWYAKTVEVKAPGKGDVFVQLEENYPKLGKIGSEYSQVQ